MIHLECYHNPYGPLAGANGRERFGAMGVSKYLKSLRDRERFGANPRGFDQHILVYCIIIYMLKRRLISTKVGKTFPKIKPGRPGLCQLDQHVDQRISSESIVNSQRISWKLRRRPLKKTICIHFSTKKKSEDCENHLNKKPWNTIFHPTSKFVIPTKVTHQNLLFLPLVTHGNHPTYCENHLPTHRHHGNLRVPPLCHPPQEIAGLITA